MICKPLKINVMSSEKEVDPSSLLTKREKEVLWLLINEKNTEEISDALLITKSTVISHRKNMLIKLHAKNTAGMIRKCYHHGILYLDDERNTRILNHPQ